MVLVKRDSIHNSPFRLLVPLFQLLFEALLDVTFTRQKRDARFETQDSLMHVSREERVIQVVLWTLVVQMHLGCIGIIGCRVPQRVVLDSLECCLLAIFVFG